MARFHGAGSFVAFVVRNVREAVKMLTDAVPAVGFDDRTVVFGGDCGDFFANVSVSRVWFDYGHAFRETLVRALEQFERFFFATVYSICYFFARCFFCSAIAFIAITTYKYGFVQVAVVSAEKRRDVDIHDISFLQRPTIRNTVTNNFVYAYAARLWEAIVI